MDDVRIVEESYEPLFGLIVEGIEERHIIWGTFLIVLKVCDECVCIDTYIHI